MLLETVESFSRRIAELEKQVQALCLVMAGAGVETPPMQRVEAMDIVLDAAKAQVEAVN